MSEWNLQNHAPTAKALAANRLGRKMFCPYLKGAGIDAQGGRAGYELMNADATYLMPNKVFL